MKFLHNFCCLFQGIDIIKYFQCKLNIGWMYWLYSLRKSSKDDGHEIFKIFKHEKYNVKGNKME